MPDWLIGRDYPLYGIALSALAVYVAVLLYTRISGLRSFAKMSAFDFAVTVAIGSMVSTTVLSGTTSILQALVGIGAVFVIQHIVGALRERYDWAQYVTDNAPILLMDGEEVLHDNLRRGRVSESDLRAKLREANVIRLSQVRAVILESTGDVSVLHADDADLELEDVLLEGVIR